MPNITVKNKDNTVGVTKSFRTFLTALFLANAAANFSEKLRGAFS